MADFSDTISAWDSLPPIFRDYHYEDIPNHPVPKQIALSWIRHCIDGEKSDETFANKWRHRTELWSGTSAKSWADIKGNLTYCLYMPVKGDIEGLARERLSDGKQLSIKTIASRLKDSYGISYGNTTMRHMLRTWGFRDCRDDTSRPPGLIAPYTVASQLPDTVQGESNDELSALFTDPQAPMAAIAPPQPLPETFDNESPAPLTAPEPHIAPTTPPQLMPETLEDEHPTLLTTPELHISSIAPPHPLPASFNDEFLTPLTTLEPMSSATQSLPLLEISDDDIQAAAVASSVGGCGFDFCTCCTKLGREVSRLRRALQKLQKVEDAARNLHNIISTPGSPAPSRGSKRRRRSNSVLPSDFNSTNASSESMNFSQLDLSSSSTSVHNVGYPARGSNNPPTLSGDVVGKDIRWIGGIFND